MSTEVRDFNCWREKNESPRAGGLFFSTDQYVLICFETTVPAALETPETALFKMPIGRPRMLRLTWLDELELVLELLLLELKSDFSRLDFVLVVEESELVVSASPAEAFCSAAPSESTVAMRRIAMRRERDDREEVEGSCMEWRALVRVM